MRPLLLDLYCCAGGAGEGYRRAGFDVFGVDLDPQPNYPFPFFRGDALALLDDLLAYGPRRFAAVHASPPCQLFTPLGATQAADYATRHVDLIGRTRVRLRQLGLPWIMENVPQAPLRADVTLCGSMFDLPVKRHRAFEASFPLTAPPCAHRRWRELWPDGFASSVSRKRLESGARQPTSQVVGVYGSGGGAGKDLGLWRWAMGTPWMQTKHEVAESIPPAYTEFLGHQLMAHIGR